MNLSTDQAQPLQPQRLSTSCDLHPDELFSGFCPSCLCERLSVLDAPLPPSSSKKPPNISLKALFKPSTSTRPGFFPELRRSKSFSAKNNEGFSSSFEPQRRSCDVTSSSRNVPSLVVKIEDEARKSSVSERVFENEITEEQSNEIVEEEEDELKPMKDHIDLYPQTKKPSMKSFFSAASGFSKKLQKWTHKQKNKKQRKSQLSENTQSEIADYGYGRRSSDTDPRFSLDAGRFSVDISRISVDESRYSIDEKPRASWDGHLLAKTASKIPPSSSSDGHLLAKNASKIPPLSSDGHLLARNASKSPSDGHLLVRKTSKIPPPPSMLSVMENASNMQDPSSPTSDPVITIPGGTNQTRDYYTGPPSRRRKSLDRSNSIRKIVGSELDEVKTVSSHSKVSPAINIDSVETEENQDKKSRRWGKWSMFGFMYKKNGSKEDEEEEDRYSRSNSAGVAERSVSESWPEMRRSNSNVSWRSSGGGGSVRSKDNGMLRFYLTPMRRSWRKGGGGGGDGGGDGGRWEKTAAKANSHAVVEPNGFKNASMKKKRKQTEIAKVGQELLLKCKEMNPSQLLREPKLDQTEVP